MKTLSALVLTLALGASAGAAVPPTAKVPAVVVPGILGSMSSCLFEPSCCDPTACDPACSTYWDPYGPIGVQLDCRWVLDPIRIFLMKDPTYESLIQALEQAGYAKGTTLFQAAYDWRNPCQTSAEAFLSPVIEAAKRISGHAQVDVVAHSMGGLVTRWYIEGLGKTDVRRFGMLGTPNYGSAQAYNPWEGGDFSTYEWSERQFFLEPLILDMKVGYDVADLSDREAVQLLIPSIRQLLPVDDYLWDVGARAPVPVGDMVWQNDLAPLLDYDRLVSTVGLANLAMGIGSGSSTLRGLKVGAPEGEDWSDGRPLELPPTDARQFSTEGDGTVLASNARLGDIRTATRDCAHVDLPDCYRYEVVDFFAGATALAGAPAARPPTPAAAVPDGLLLVATRAPVRLGLVTPEGRRTGDFGRTESADDVPGRYLRRTGRGTAALGLYGPTAGRYLLQVTGEAGTAYELNASLRPAGSATRMTTVLKGTLDARGSRAHVLEVGEELRAR